jgi:hypothetical protein
MIITEKKGDIFTTEDKHIVFALNTNGYNDGGFAGQVAKRGFTEILNTGGNQLGEVLEKTIDGITYHGIVCHSLEPGGWAESPEIILKALNEMTFDDNASIVAIGAGFISALSGAPWDRIKESFNKCNKRLTIWTY